MLLIGNGRLITHDSNQPYLPNGCVAITDNLITAVGPTAHLRKEYPSAAFIDAKDRIIMPGMINTHMHLYSAFARGMVLKSDPALKFTEILEKLWWRLDKVLTLQDIYYSAMVGLIDCIKHGTTTIFDHHASPGAVEGSLFMLAEATQAIGVRSCLCYEVSDRDGQGVMKEGIKENTSFIKYANHQSTDLVRGMFGLHASMTLSDNTLNQCLEANANLKTGFHSHVAEAAADVEDAIARSGKRVVERLADFGILNSQSIAAHCVHVNKAEIEMLRQTGVNVIHNPESNMGNAVGCAPVIEMLEQGVTVGLGTDGYTADMFESYKVANLLHKHHYGNPSIAWQEPPTMLFKHNGNIGSKHFSKPLGQFIAGSYADIIIVDYNPPTVLNEENLYGHILFGMSGKSVVTTIVNGKVVMNERQLVGIDEDEIYAKARQLSGELWKRF